MVNHVVVMPYPGRGHINPMMNLCHLLSFSLPDALFTFIVTEEWLGFIDSDPKPENFRFATIPNVLPSELVRGADVPNFVKSVLTKMEQPFDELLDRLDLQPKLIVADTFLVWAIHVGNRRNIPVASFWTMSAAMFLLMYHSNLIIKNPHYPFESSGKEESVDNIPGLSPLKVADLPTMLFDPNKKLLQQVVDSFHEVHKTQYLLLTTVYELEAEAIEALKSIFKLPVYTIGPNIPFFEVPNRNKSNYFEWLDSKPLGTVLYVSLGSYLSVSSAQLDEIAAGLKESGVNYLMVARGETNEITNGKEANGDGEGMIVPWCDQLRVLAHPSVGGFLTHCGWNSVKESIFMGVPMLTFPILVDQVPNSKFIVEDWKIGLKVRKQWKNPPLVKREEIAKLVSSFMNLESLVRKEMMERVKRLKDTFQQSVAEGGSASTSINAFIRDISS